MTDKYEQLNEVLEFAYLEAEKYVINEQPLPNQNQPHIKAASDLAKVKHASRGAALTLLGYRLVDPDQDIRAHKDKHDGGFSARSYDSRVTVPFLIEKSLPRSVETHWLTQTLSFADVLLDGVELTTVPKAAGPLLVQVVNFAQRCDADEINGMVLAILIELIKIRNKDKVILTRPKNLPIDSVKELLISHFGYGYRNNAPRLPQLAIYSIYQTIIGKVSRFEGQTLDGIQRMKSADRKAGTVGDIVLLDGDGEPVEAVEIKFAQAVTDLHVCEAIEKVRGAMVSRYYVLSTEGIAPGDLEVISKRKSDFLKQNGCEIIVNGVVETIGYYLRLMPNTSEFLNHYATLVESDRDTGYEHRIAWNELCASI